MNPSLKLGLALVAVFVLLGASLVVINSFRQIQADEQADIERINNLEDYEDYAE